MAQCEETPTYFLLQRTVTEEQDTSQVKQDFSFAVRCRPHLTLICPGNEGSLAVTALRRTLKGPYRTGNGVSYRHVART